MSDEPINLWSVVGMAVSAVVGFGTNYLKERKDRTRAVQAELKDFGGDIIEELRTDLALARNERKHAFEAADKQRDMAWRWRTEHSELAVENDGLRQQLEFVQHQLRESLSRATRLAEDVERYQRELADTNDLAKADDTGPIKPSRRR